jgi:hypothetical protein
MEQQAAAFLSVSRSVNALKFYISKINFFTIFQNSDSFFLMGCWSDEYLTIMNFMKFIMPSDVISMIMSEENSLKFCLSILEELIVFGDIILWINNDGFTIGLYIIRVNGQTTDKHLFNVETLTIVR